MDNLLIEFRFYLPGEERLDYPKTLGKIDFE